MTNKDFDTALSQLVSDEVLPFDERNWERMLARLDKPQSKKLLALPLLVTMPQWAAAACIAITVSAAIWHATTNNSTTPADNITSVNQQATTTTPPANSAPDTNHEQTAAPIQRTIAAKPSIVKPTKKLTKPLEERGNELRVVTLPEAGHTPVVADIPKEPKKNTTYPSVVFFDPSRRAENRISVNLNGGFAIQNGNGIAAGITVRNRLGNKVSLETNIGYIQGNQDIPYKNQRTTTMHPPEVGQTDTSQRSATYITETFYEQHKRNLPYLQLSPAVNIKLHKKLNGSIGVDVQKILIDKPTLQVLNERLAVESKKIPSVDPGLTLNLNYSLTKRIGCGVAYRESMINFGSKAGEYINRDYFTFQLQYTIIK